MFVRWLPLLPNPLWYLTIVPELEAFQRTLTNENHSVRHTCTELLYDFFESHSSRSHIALAANGIGADAERKKIDTIVIHHTSNPPGLRPERLSAIELIRLYAPYFAHPTLQVDRHLNGKLIGSGHLRNGKQVFWPYHWLVRKNGNAERLLYNSEIGWHAGNWAINCSSIAIALDNDYEHSVPSKTELDAIANIIKCHYPYIPLARILGHREVNPRTSCPSELFLNSADCTGWKFELLSSVAKHSQRAA